MLDAAAAAAARAAADRPPVERRRRLSPAALAVTNQKVQRAYSPIVIAGAVRARRFRAAQPGRHRDLSRAMSCRSTASTGTTSPAILGMTAAAVICFQAADIYDVQVFRGHAAADDADDLGLGVRVPAVHRRLVLRQARRRGLARLAVGLLRRRPRRADRRTRCSCAAMVRRWARDGRLDRRTIIVGADQNGEKLIEALQGAGRFRSRHPRRVRRPQRQPRARHLRRQPEARQDRRHRRIRAPHPHRSRAVRAADLGRDAHPRDAEEAVGAAGRYPPVGAHQQAALPPALLFLSRRGADARRVRGADHRLGPGDEMAVRPRRRRAASCCCGAAGDGAGRAGDQARQPGPGAVQAEALRLQQRAHRRLQVSLAVPRPGRSAAPPRS